jgi:hypothetical protein
MSSNIQNELIQIIDIEQATPLSWYDWWNYWSTFIGISVFISAFLLLTLSYHSTKSSNVGTLVEK